MTLQMPAPVLADIGDVVAIAFVIIAILGWLSNLIAAKKPPERPAGGARPRRPAQPGGERISEEIEIFLEQITGQKPARKKPSSTVSVQKPRRLAPSRKKPAQTPQPQKPKRVRPGSRISKRTLADSSQLGEDVRSHISEHMEAGHISEHVATHLDHDVNEGVQQHLGVFGGADAERFENIDQPRRQISASARQIVDLLRDPNGVRQAILISEILSPPKGSRRRS